MQRGLPGQGSRAELLRYQELAEVEACAVMIDLLINREVQSGNKLAYGHWRHRMKDKQAWMILIKSFLLRSLTSLASDAQQPKGKRSVHVLGYRKRILDDDNFIAGFKHGRDCLVTLGLLKDDNATWCSFTYEQQLASKHPSKRPCTFITIQDL